MSTPHQLDKVEAKLTAATLVTGFLSITAGILVAVQDNPAILGGLPPWLQFVILAAIPPALSFAAGYFTRSNRV